MKLDRKKMREYLHQLGFSDEVMRAMGGPEKVLRSHLLSLDPELAEQTRMLLCDADSESATGAREDLKDLINRFRI